MNADMTRNIATIKVREDGFTESPDCVAVEEPLEIRIATAWAAPRGVSVTMRTPGNDSELALGFLWGEGVITASSQIDRPLPVLRDDPNIINVHLSGVTSGALARLERSSYTTSSCGICGKSSLTLIHQRSQFAVSATEPIVEVAVLHRLHDIVRQRQGAFDQTGGLHAAGLFEADGHLIDLKEDVGRHNAVDKIIGAQMLLDNLPLSNQILFLSGRASFELLQKATMAGISVVAAVGAPSSLAVELAGSEGITLIGFLRDQRFNIYAGPQRVREPVAAAV